MFQDNLRKRARGGATDSTDTTSPQYTLTRKVVSHHSGENDAWVIYKRGVYDITLFLESHPGGPDILRDHLGKDITNLMQGGDQSSTLHEHSAFAYKLLSKYKIGQLADTNENEPAPDGNTDAATGQPLVRWDRPILHQIGMLGSKYERWIHSFPTTDHTVQMFPNAALERLTKCAWYVPLLFWIPVICIEFAHYLHLMQGVGNVSAVVFVSMVAFGFVGWLLFEYTLHRFVFHMGTSGYYGNILHFLLHGHHHITPMDFDRLVFPPVPAMILGAPIWYAAPKVLGVHAGYPWLIGFVVGYLVYDMTHFWIHHAVPKNAFLKRQKRRHVHHHYFQPMVNFGISNPLFDVVFGTLTEPQM